MVLYLNVVVVSWFNQMVGHDDMFFVVNMQINMTSRASTLPFFTSHLVVKEVAHKHSPPKTHGPTTIQL